MARSKTKIKRKRQLWNCARLRKKKGIQRKTPQNPPGTNPNSHTAVYKRLSDTVVRHNLVQPSRIRRRFW